MSTVEALAEVEEVAQDETITKEVNTEIEELVVSIGDEEVSPPSEDLSNAAFAKLRIKNAELEKQIAAQKPEVKVRNLRAMPKEEDHDFDDDLYRNDMNKWLDERDEDNTLKNKAETEQKRQNDTWNNRVKKFEDDKIALGATDYEDAELVVNETMSETQRGLIIAGADNPAQLLYVLGKSPSEAKRLSEIKDPAKFAFAVSKLETKAKVTKRTSLPPEKRLEGSSFSGSGEDTQLNALELEADKSGDRSAVLAYKRELRRK